MPISNQQCAPYLSTTLFKIAKPAPSVSALRDAIIAQLEMASHASNETSLRRKVQKVDRPVFKRGKMDIGWFHYAETRPPPWYIGQDLKDERHHIVFVVRKNDIVALTFSDAVFRSSIVSEIKKGSNTPLASLKILTVKQINDAFVGNRVRTLWLTGTHRKITTKADSKILSGIELESALNPLGDQSYYFSSVRSTLDKPVLATKTNSSAIVGANPRNSRIWLGSSPDWESFIDRVDALVDIADEAIKNPAPPGAPLPVLAQPTEALGEVNAPYDMAITGESVPSGIEGDPDDPWLHEFCDAARFEISSQTDSPSFEAEVFWGSESYGRIKYDFVAVHQASLKVTAKAFDWKNDRDYHEEIRKICENTELLKVYYDTGHTFSGGQFYTTTFRDARFDKWAWASLAGFDIGAEKPLDEKRLLIEDIGKENDSSLFGFVAKHWNYPDNDKPVGWLVCDDGSMESADFIHFDDRETPPRLTLIHVKGSGSVSADRGVSVSDYEVVVSQAVKNLRHIDRVHISEKLAANQDAQIGSAVWRDGKRQDSRKEILKILAKAGSNMNKRVCILQPRVRRSEVIAIEKRIAKRDLDRPEVRRLQQLDALLLGARANCFELGAEFWVIGENDLS